MIRKMTLARSDRDWSVLLSEYNICKKKLESKREAVKILMKDLEQSQIERDIYKNKVCQLQQELDELKELLGGYWRDRKSGSLFTNSDTEDKKVKTLTQLLQHVREENQALQHDLTTVRQLYTEAQRDSQLLREAMSKHENQKKETSLQKQGKERLIEQLEEAQNKIEGLQKDIEIINDEKSELFQERDFFKDKVGRLNKELNYVLHNDERRLVDVDAVVLENKYLKEVVKQYKEEKAMAIASMARYKEALERRYQKANRFLSYIDMPMSFTKKRLTSSLESSRGSPHKAANPDTVDELQRVAQSLTESLTDKDTALKHQRNTNRALGTRVRELEKKLKTLEISGLWSLDGQKIVSPTLERVSMSFEEIMKDLNENSPHTKTQSENGEDKNDDFGDERISDTSSDIFDSIAVRVAEKEGILVDLQEQKETETDVSNKTPLNGSSSRTNGCDSLEYRVEAKVKRKHSSDEIVVPSSAACKKSIDDYFHDTTRRTVSCPATPQREVFKSDLP